MFKKHNVPQSYSWFTGKSFMDLMPHMDWYSVMYSQQECTLELIVCVIHPGIPLLLSYSV